MTSLRRWLLLAPWLLCSALVTQAAAPLEGRWEGTIAVPGAPITMVLDLAQASGSTWVGSVVLPGFGIKGAPVGELIVNDDNVRLTLPGALRGPSDDAPALQARATDAQTLVGEFRLAGLTAPVRLTRTGAAQVDLPLASTAIAPALVGKWIGSYELGGYARQVMLTLSMDGEKARAQMVIVGKRTSEVAFDLIRQGECFLTLQSAQTGVSYFATSDSSLYHVVDAATGKQVLQQQSKAYLFSSPTIAGDVVLIGVLNGTLEARDFATGALLWDYSTDAARANQGWALTADRRFNTPMIFRSGWREGMAVAFARQSSVGSIFSTPLVVGGVVYVGSADGRLYALE